MLNRDIIRTTLPFVHLVVQNVCDVESMLNIRIYNGFSLMASLTFINVRVEKFLFAIIELKFIMIILI